MSDTPETDKLDGRLDYSVGAYLALKHHANKLERERDVARFDLAFRRELYAVQALQLAEARKTILELQHKTL